MKEKILFFSIKHPLLLILMLAMTLKLVAMIFTGGFIYEDEYLNYYKVPSAWLENSWLVFSIRLIIGFFSLLIITLSYRIVKVISDKKTALEVAILLATLWFIPYVTVHPLPQVLTIPFLLYGTLLIVKQDFLLANKEIEKFHRTTFIIAGLCFGLGFTFWYQSALYYLGIIIALMILKNWRGTLMTIIGFIVAICVTETAPDIIWHGQPFYRICEFFNNGGAYLSSKSVECQCVYYSLPIILLGFLPPLSLMIIFGYFRVCRKYLLLFLPAMLFLLFYLIFPNLNIIYLLPVTPTYVICGFVGWKEFKRKSAFWERNKKLLLCLNALTITANVVLLVMIFVKTYNII